MWKFYYLEPIAAGATWRLGPSRYKWIAVFGGGTWYPAVWNSGMEMPSDFRFPICFLLVRTLALCKKWHLILNFNWFVSLLYKLWEHPLALLQPRMGWVGTVAFGSVIWVLHWPRLESFSLAATLLNHRLTKMRNWKMIQHSGAEGKSGCSSLSRNLRRSRAYLSSYNYSPLSYIIIYGYCAL